MIRLYSGTAFCALVAAFSASTSASAQSTGTQTFERPDIVVTAARPEDKTIGGTNIPQTPKERRSFDQDIIDRSVPGQTIVDILNYMPGVSFQNNGPYGDANGTLTIHGFDGSRIALTFDGIPQNDSGNYALYTQDQLDHELIERVDVSLGSTDIDSPTASATGSTINYVTRNPTKDFHARLEGSAGQFGFQRIFGVIDTGEFTKFGTRAFVSASHQSDSDPYNPAIKLEKYQFNAKLYQPLGSNGDFISIASWYSADRGNRFDDVLLRTTSGGFPADADARNTATAPCTTTSATTGKDTANTCGTAYGLGSAPSNNFNVRGNSRFTLTDRLLLTVDPSYSHTKANGSSAVAATEGGFTLNGKSIYGFIGGKPYFGGVVLNGDGDTLDTVEVNAPSNTVTNRYIAIANLIYKLTPTQTVRLNYTFDDAHLRQTGEVGLLQVNGKPASYFPSDDPLRDVSGNPIEKRNRTTTSMLNQVAAEYRGEFFENKLVVQAGVRVPFFKRDLNNLCVSEASGNGFVDCFNDPASQAAFLLAHPTYQAPQARQYNYNKALPEAGFVFNVTGAASLFFNYSQGIQVPSTDDLYDAFSFPTSDPAANTKPETTYNFEGGVRYKTRHIQAEVSGWYTKFDNRIVSSTIPDPQTPGSYITTFANLGNVHKYGVDASVAYRPIRQFTLYAFGSYLHSKIADNIQTGACSANNAKFGDIFNGVACTVTNQPIIALTGGKQESGSPDFMYGARAQGNFGPFSLGVQAKHTGSRFVNDQNSAFVSGTTSATANTVIFPAKAAGYTLTDLDARVNLGFLGLNKLTFFQLNVHNVFDKFYIGGFGGGTISNSFVPFVYIGTPRTISGTVNIAF